MNCSRYIIALITLFAVKAGYAQPSTIVPFIGIEDITGIDSSVADSFNINQTYTLNIKLRNYVPNSSFFGPATIYLQTNIGDANGLPAIILNSDNMIALSPNTQQVDSVIAAYTPEAGYFVFGGGITTVVVWPMINAPTDEPYIWQVRALGVTGIKEHTAGGDLTLFPNPAGEQIAVVFTGKADIQALKIYNQNGQLIANENLQQNAKNVVVYNTATLSAGMYIAEVVTTNGSIRRKFIKL